MKSNNRTDTIDVTKSRVVGGPPISGEVKMWTAAPDFKITAHFRIYRDDYGKFRAKRLTARGFERDIPKLAWSTLTAAIDEVITRRLNAEKTGARRYAI